MDLIKSLLIRGSQGREFAEAVTKLLGSARKIQVSFKDHFGGLIELINKQILPEVI
jgi:hypothetical protein